MVTVSRSSQSSPAEASYLSQQAPSGWSAQHVSAVLRFQWSVDSQRLLQLSIRLFINTIWLVRRIITSVWLRPKQYVDWSSLLSLRPHFYLSILQPYYQPSPAPPTPFTIESSYSDPALPSGNNAAWGMNIQSSSDIILFGAGFYSFFQVRHSRISISTFLIEIYFTELRAGLLDH